MKVFRILIALLLLTVTANGQTKEELQKQKVLLQDQIDLANTLLEQTKSTRESSINQLQTLNQKIEARERLIKTMNGQISRIDLDIRAKAEAPGRARVDRMMGGNSHEIMFVQWRGAKAKLEETLSNARLIDESQLDTSKALILSTVTIKNKVNNQQMTYTLVAESEADLKSGKISVNSPIGKGLLGKSVGDIAEIQVPNGVIQFEIVEITRS